MTFYWKRLRQKNSIFSISTCIAKSHKRIRATSSYKPAVSLQKLMLGKSFTSLLKFNTKSLQSNLLTISLNSLQFRLSKRNLFDRLNQDKKKKDKLMLKPNSL